VGKRTYVFFYIIKCVTLTCENYETILYARDDILADYFLRKIYIVNTNKRNSVFKNGFSVNFYAVVDGRDICIELVSMVIY
jgi:hypothetical protein